MDLNSTDIFIRVIFAMVLGGLIGLERELARKPAGVRTHMFVAGSATLVLLIGQYVISQYTRVNSNIQADPARIVEAIIVGISFIGAGTVLKSSEQKQVFYLTTAASILFTAGIGIVVGVGLYWLAVALSATAFVVSFVFGRVEEHFLDTHKHKEP